MQALFVRIQSKYHTISYMGPGAKIESSHKHSIKNIVTKLRRACVGGVWGEFDEENNRSICKIIFYYIPWMKITKTKIKLSKYF